MEIKEFEIVAPEGYELDKENSTLERIVLKKKDDKPRTWEEFCKRGFTGKEAYVTREGFIKSIYNKGDFRHNHMVGYVDSVKEAKAFQALMQLRQLRKAWVGDWEPDWRENDIKGVVDSHDGGIRFIGYTHTNRPLSFPTENMAYEFLKCFKDLLEQAKMLL